MNQMKITFAGVVTRRWKENTKSGKEICYVAVKVPRVDWEDVLRLKVKDADLVKPFAVGAKVNCEAFVGGREWKNPETGKASYFVDLNLYKIESEKKEEPKPSKAENETVDYDDAGEEMPF